MEQEILTELKEINKNLSIVISLLLKTLPHDADNPSLREQIKLLDNLGVRPKDIAIYLSRKPSHISKELVSLRKIGRKEKQK